MYPSSSQEAKKENIRKYPAWSVRAVAAAKSTAATDAPRTRRAPSIGTSAHPRELCFRGEHAERGPSLARRDLREERLGLGGPAVHEVPGRDAGAVGGGVQRRGGERPHLGRRTLALVEQQAVPVGRVLDDLQLARDRCQQRVGF